MRRSGGTWGLVGGLALLAALSAACSETGPLASERGTTSTAPTGALTRQAGDGSIVSLYGGEPWFAGKVPETAEPADRTATPIKVGVMTTDEGPVAALPELHRGIDAAVAWINDELGGIDGRPIETVFCAVDLSAEKSQQCARTMVSEGVVAVLAGIDIASGDAVAVLEENGIPWVGGIPLNVDEMDSPYAFQFSGGSGGAFVAFAHHATTVLKAQRVSLMYVNLPQIASGTHFATDILDAAGVEVTEVPFDLTTQDFAGIARKAAEGDPDAIIVGAADFACPKVMQAVHDLGSEATPYLVGSCADRKWLDQVSPEARVGGIFNVEGALDQSVPNADNELYHEVMARYEPETAAQGAATVSFRGAMNLWAVANEVTADEGLELTSESLVAAFRATKEHPSFDGHPFTCDGKQVPGLCALCATQQMLIRSTADGFEAVTTDWIDVPAILAGRE